MKVIPTPVKIAVLVLPGIIFMAHYNQRMETQRFEPHIYTLGAGKILVAEIKGDPDVTMDDAGTTFYNSGRKLKLSPSYMGARHVHWNQRDTTPEKEWVVQYSRMVPETAVDLPDIEQPAHVKIFYDRREETEIAELLHIGRYEEIPDSLEKLRRFIANEGYTLSGFYEEVYIVFEQIEPNPGEYETLLRYQVAKGL